MTLHTLLLIWSLPLGLAAIVTLACMLRRNHPALVMLHDGVRIYARVSAAAALIVVAWLVSPYGGGCNV